MGQGFVELGADITLFRVRYDDVEVLLQALHHFWRDTAEGEDSFFHGYRARRAQENGWKATSFERQAAS
ncbi:hypothetical protein D3C72_2461120 [compost metagenome]